MTISLLRADYMSNYGEYCSLVNNYLSGVYTLVDHPVYKDKIYFYLLLFSRRRIRSGEVTDRTERKSIYAQN